MNLDCRARQVHEQIVYSKKTYAAWLAKDWLQFAEKGVFTVLLFVFFVYFAGMAFQAIFFRCQSFYLVVLCLFHDRLHPSCAVTLRARLAIYLNVCY